MPLSDQARYGLTSHRCTRGVSTTIGALIDGWATDRREREQLPAHHEDIFNLGGLGARRRPEKEVSQERFSPASTRRKSALNSRL